MSEVQRLIVKDDGTEYDLYIQSKTDADVPKSDEDEPVYRDINIPTVNIQDVQDKIRNYAKFALGAFKNFTDAEVEEVTIKFGIKLGGKTGIPFLTEGSAESNFEIEVKCKFPDPQKSQNNS